MLSDKRQIPFEWLKDIRFWILLFFILRLYGITDAPLENGHNWRQSLTNMIARNFLQEGNNIIYPRIDYDGTRTGIIGSEFPLFNYFIYLFSAVAGYGHWYGRLINLVVSSVGIWYFYKILRYFFSQEHAFYSGLILICSLWLSFSRKSMPDTFCVSLVMIGIYHGMIYLYSEEKRRLLFFFIFSSLAVLCKIPALYLLSIMILPVLDKKVELRRKLNVLFTGALILSLMILWYFYWVPAILANEGFQLYFPKSFSEGVSELLSNWKDTFEKFYFSAMSSYIAFAVFVAGLVIMLKGKQKLLLAIFCIATFFFFLFIIKTGSVFSLHNYYVIPYVPVMAIVAGYAILRIKNNKVRVFLLFAIMAESILNQQHDLRIKDTEHCKLRMEGIADQFSTRKDLFLTNGGQSPQQIYFLNRRGWSMKNEEITADELNRLKGLGCKYVFLNRHDGEPVGLSPSLTMIYRDDDFFVYSL